MDIWSILIVVIIFQGLFLLSVLLMSPKKRTKKGNGYLSFLILLFIWFLSEFLAIRNTFHLNFDIFYGTRYGSWLLLGPLTFFFFKSITDSQWRFSRMDLFHFLPFLIFVLIIPLWSTDSLSSRQIHYGMLSVFDYRKKVVTPFEYLYSVLFILQYIHLGLYLIKNIKTIKTYSEDLKLEYSHINHVIWLWVFNILLIFVLLMASVYLYILFASDFYKRSLDYIYVLPMGFFVYSIAYRLAGIHWLSVEQKERKYSGSSLKTNEKEQYALLLKNLMLKDKPYLKNDLRLKELAHMLDINAHHLSQIINENFKCSFFDFINQYRIEEAKQLILAQPRLTMLQVTFDSGFNNKTSFVNAFKKFEKITPSRFRATRLNS
ncbi:MAG: helix-turn-helix domain-containing protein [Saonia sp.]